MFWFCGWVFFWLRRQQTAKPLEFRRFCWMDMSLVLQRVCNACSQTHAAQCMVDYLTGTVPVETGNVWDARNKNIQSGKHLPPS